MGRILLRVRDRVTDMCRESPRCRHLFDLKHCSINTEQSVLQAGYIPRLRETLCLLSRCMQERGPLTSRTSAWVVWHSCSDGAWLSVVGAREAESSVCDWALLFCGLNLLYHQVTAHRLNALCHIMGRILLRVRDPVTDMCCVVT